MGYAHAAGARPAAGPVRVDGDVRKVIDAMLEDVRRESEGEVEWSVEVSKAVARATSKMLLAREACGIFAESKAPNVRPIAAPPG